MSEPDPTEMNTPRAIVAIGGLLGSFFMSFALGLFVLYFATGVAGVVIGLLAMLCPVAFFYVIWREGRGLGE